jgi:hypothetical protein
MAASIPTNEPSELRAGDTWKWRREDLEDYPAPTWTLKYRFKNAAGGFEVTAAADGVAHAVVVAAATTAPYAAGSYAWVAWVESGAEKYTVDSGELRVLPDLRAGTATAAQDVRSHARRVLEAIEAVLEGRATRDQEEYRIGERMLKRTPIADLLALRDRYKAEVESEAVARRVMAGETPGYALQVRL